MFDTLVGTVLLLIAIWYFVVYRNRESRPTPPENHVLNPAVEQDVILRALERPPFTEVLTDEQLDELRYLLQKPRVTRRSKAAAEPTPAFDPARLKTDPTRWTWSADDAQPPGPAVVDTGKSADPPDTRIVPPSRPVEPAPEPEQPKVAAYTAPVSHDLEPPTKAAPAPAAPAAAAIPTRAEKPTQMPLPRTQQQRTRPSLPKLKRESIRPDWDPAVIMLYLGALLVVFAGLIFATYNWGSMSPWQKLGLLAAGTLAFLGAGWLLRNNQRIKPAAKSFMVVGAMLVPLNALAAYTVFGMPDPMLPLLIGAISTVVVHGIIARQPGGGIFAYSATFAAILALAAVPGAIGFQHGWGAPLALAAIALLPDPFGKLDSFVRPWMYASFAAVLPLAVFGLERGYRIDVWIAAITWIALGLALQRIAQRFDGRRSWLAFMADIPLIIASAQVGHILGGTEWMLPAGLLAISLLLWRYSRQRHHYASVLELASGTVFALFIANLVYEWYGSQWMAVALVAALAVVALVHAFRWPETRIYTEATAALLGPVAIGLAASAAGFEQWSMFGLFASLTVALLLHQARHAALRALTLALATFAGIATTFAFGLGAEFSTVSPWVYLLGGTALAYGAIANVATPPRIPDVIVDLLRAESTLLFALVLWIDGGTRMWMSLIALGMTMWTLARTRHVGWTLPAAFLIQYVLVTHVLPVQNAGIKQGWYYLAVATIIGAFACQLDRRASPNATFATGALAWLMAGWNLIPATAGFVEQQGQPVLASIGMLLIAALFVVAAFSTELKPVASLAVPYIVFANVGLLLDMEGTGPHLIVAAILAGLASLVFRPGGVLMVAVGATCAGLAALHVQRSFETGYLAAAVIGLAAAWIVFGLGAATQQQTTHRKSLVTYIVAGAALHVVALFGPLIDHDADALTRGILVLTLVSLAMVIAAGGALLRDRLVVVGGSAIAMLALLLQIESGDPGSVHAYSIPLAIYLLAIGWVYRRNAAVSGILMAAGSAVLLTPALVEAISPTSTNWLWLAFAEAAALFVFGAVMRLRVPLYASSLVVGVISFRMLVDQPTLRDQLILIVLMGAAAAWWYLRNTIMDSWIGLAFLALAAMHIQQALTSSWIAETLVGLILAWALFAAGFRMYQQRRVLLTHTALEAATMHAIAFAGPALWQSTSGFTRSMLVLTLVSLAALTAAFGAILRDRVVVIAASAIAMVALIIQIHGADPGTIHAYTLPLGAYVIALGGLMRKLRLIGLSLIRLGSVVLITPAVYESLIDPSMPWMWLSLAEAIALIALSVLIRNREPFYLGAAAILMLSARFLSVLESTQEHVLILAILAALAAWIYLRFERLHTWLAAATLATAMLHLQLAIDSSWMVDTLAGLTIAWLLFGWAIARYRNGGDMLMQLTAQAGVLHVLALLGSLETGDASTVPAHALQITLLSLAGVVAVYGYRVRNRLIVLAGTAIAMVALMLRIQASGTESVHAFSLPLAVYLLAVGLVLRRDPRIANTLLAAGSLVLVVPAMLEALTTGSMTWLWIALAEALGLFLLGTILRLRIPTAAGVIAVTVIVLRMLVFAINALSSWVGVLIIGLALLAIGTAWLMFRDAFRARYNALIARWRSYA